jgi:protease I
MEGSAQRAVIFVDNSYQELEAWYPYLRLQEAGVSVHFCGAKAGQVYESKLGYPAKAEFAYSELSVAEFDAVVIPGGFAPDRIRRHREANLFVKQMNDAGKLVAAICHGPWVLCSADGLLRGRRVTAFHSIKDDVVNAGARWEESCAVADGNLVTAQGPEDLPRFMQLILERLQ